VHVIEALASEKMEENPVDFAIGCVFSFRFCVGLHDICH